MLIPPHPVPANENERLDALKAYDILDTLPEKEYDAIARLASYICETPLAFISFIDPDREWFKARCGLDIEFQPRINSFCRYTILSDQLVEVSDVTQHELFSESEHVKDGLNVRFYAGAPLIDPEGHRLGSLCVLDVKPKRLTEQQREALQTLASEVISHLVLRRQKKELELNLQRHQEFYNLFESSSEIHFIASADSTIEVINKSVKTILGFEPDEAIGKSLWDFVGGGQSRDNFVHLIEKGVLSGKTIDLETAVRTKDGEIRWISWCAINKNGKWYASGRDITTQKRVAAELEQLSLVASKVNNGVVISDAEDKVVWTNEAFEKITGYTLQDVEHKQLREVLKGKIADQIIAEELENQIRGRQSYEIDLLITRKGGEPIWISVINNLIRNVQGEVEKQIRVIIDITARKNAEKDVEILTFAARELPTGLLIRDRDSNVIWMNEAQEKIFGYTLEEMQGKKFGEVLLGDGSDRQIYAEARKAIEENQPYEVELKIYTKEGEPRWVFLSNTPFLDSSGDVSRQIGVTVDITERKQAELQLQLLSLVASNATSGVVINDSQGEVEWVNNAFEEITGYSLADVKQKHLGDILQGELTDVSIIEKARELSQNKQSFEVDLLVYKKDGDPLWISIINSVILDRNGKVEKFIEVIIDITAKKKTELELIASKEEALQLSRAKDMFISVMSHEIRTPLNAVIGMSHLLLEDNPREVQKENLSILKFSAENLLTLINDVLDFAKIDSGNIQLEKVKVDLRELVHGVITSLQFKTGNKIYLKESIAESIPEFVLGDRTRLVQILLNLAGNAVKFTEQGGVTIELKVIEQNDSDVRIRFAVTDTGIGIAEDKINTIFESFKQAELDTTRKYGGTGLGLAITKRLVELHDSRINVDSTLGKGSTFWFAITFKKAENSSVSNHKNVELGLNINVLVVDDNQINRLLINKVLKKWGATADFAENGSEAIQKIEGNKNYEVVLMDIHMPVMGGLEAAKALRSKPDPYCQKVPIIALTASMLTNQMNQINEAGMNDYVLKPFDPKNLYEKLSRYQRQ